MEPVRRVIMDFGEISVTNHVDKGAPRVVVVKSVGTVHHAMPGIGVKNATFLAMLDVHQDCVINPMEYVPHVKLDIGM